MGPANRDGADGALVGKKVAKSKLLLTLTVKSATTTAPLCTAQEQCGHGVFSWLESDCDV
jgi:hypothetical protein